MSVDIRLYWLEFEPAQPEIRVHWLEFGESSRLVESGGKRTRSATSAMVRRIVPPATVQTPAHLAPHASASAPPLPHESEETNQRIRAMRQLEVAAHNHRVIQTIAALVATGALDEMTLG